MTNVTLEEALLDDSGQKLANVMLQASAQSGEPFSIALMMGALAHMVSFTMTNKLTLKQAGPKYDPLAMFEEWTKLARSYIEEDVRKGRMQ